MVCIFEKELTLYPKDEKSNIPLLFTVPKDSEEMKITFSYSPKELEDEASAREQIIACLIQDGEKERADSWRDYLPIVNLVTVSLDDPRGYRGCAHRHTPYQEHIIKSREASPGFIPGESVSGQWRIMLNVHALVTPECHCKIKVEAEGPDYE